MLVVDAFAELVIRSCEELENMFPMLGNEDLLFRVGEPIRLAVREGSVECVWACKRRYLMRLT